MNNLATNRWEFLNGYAVVIAMLAWIIAQSVPIELRWTASAHVWTRFMT